jgi:signal transduction histidine kinase
MEEHVSHLSELEGLNSELDGFLADLKGREEGYSVRIGDLQSQLDAARAQAEAASARLATQEATLTAALKASKSALISEISKSADLLSERDALGAKLESVSRLLDEEKARSSEKDLFIKSSRSAVKDKEAESEKIWRAMEELKAELASERAALREKEDQLRKIQKEHESLEMRSGQAVRDAARAEEGFLLKIELLKKELREQAEKAGGLERSLAAASARIDEALEEVAHKERVLAETRNLLEEKEALLKSAGAKIRELVAEAETLRSGRGRGSEELGKEIAASLAARVQELEDSLAQNSAESLDRFRKLQAELGDAKAALRKKDEENASLKGREDSLRREVQEAEEKWKLASAQLHNAAAKIREADNERDISEGRIKTLEAECERLRAATRKAESTAASLASQESRARDGESASLIAALEEQGAKYTELLKKYDELLLSAESGAMDKASLKAEAEALATRLHAMENEAAGAAATERERYAKLSERMHNADALLKKKEFELEEARGSLGSIEKECELLRKSRVTLGKKYAAEIAAEDEMISQAQARIVEQDSLISSLLSEEMALKEETEALKNEKNGFLDLVRRKTAKDSGQKASDADKQLAEKEKRLQDLAQELAKVKAERSELEESEGKLREELRGKPYRAMLREAEEKLLIKEKMLAELNSRMKRLDDDFEELKKRGPAAGSPGYMPEFEELVAGVAHQIANSISIIRSHAEFCSDSPEAEGVGDSLRVIVRNIVALQKKIDTIMNFSRPVIPQRSPERLAAIVSETLEALRVSGRIGKMSARVETEGEVPAIGVDRVRLAAAIEQLLLNASEAMPHGGDLVARISSASGRQRLEIRDTGEGIEKKNLTAVFHPFFTTRPGKMGLGLTLARNIARAHGGNLELYGEPGAGARAVLTLPEV